MSRPNAAVFQRETALIRERNICLRIAKNYLLLAQCSQKPNKKKRRFVIALVSKREKACPRLDYDL
jgi:hypothetical protein